MEIYVVVKTDAWYERNIDATNCFGYASVHGTMVGAENGLKEYAEENGLNLKDLEILKETI